MRALRFLAVVSGLAVACSALVQFRDEPDPCEAGGCKDATPVSDAGASDAAAPPDVVVADTATYDVAHLCKGAFDGWYCGFNSGLNGRAPTPDHLVYCRDGGVMMEHCDAGCVTYPTGVPDMCNSCKNKQGYYCNSQLGPQGQNAEYLSLCNGGQMIPQKKCTTKCIPGPGDAGCQ